jgi:hypothetical protein
MSVLPDRKLFFPYGDGNSSPVEHLTDAYVACDNVSLAVLESEVAKMGRELVSDEFGPCIRTYDREVSMEKWLEKRKLRIPLDSSHTYSLNTGPITLETVKDCLSAWGFCAENIDVHIVKRERRFRYGCYVVITFSKRGEKNA